MSIGEIFHPLLQLIAQTLVGLHKLVGGGSSGWSWAAAIVLLTVLIRALLFPLFVKQIKTQRAMAELQPKIKALQAKHKGDRETLNTELMKLYREHGANPLAGCLPLLLQMPVFISLYQVLHQLGPKIGADGTPTFPTKFGVAQDITESLGRAKIFGAPIAAGFNSKEGLLRALGASPGAVRTIAVVLIVAMAVTTFITSKQMMAKNAAQADPQQQMQQKILLYVMPVMLALFGFGVAIGTLIYWTTNNLFGMAQQAYVVHRMPHTPAGGTAKADSAKPAPKSGGPAPASATKSKPIPAAATESAGTPAATPATPARPGGGNRSKRKGQRRGGRR